MNVKELIKQLLDEDPESTVYVKAMDDQSGDDVFGDVDGIAHPLDSYRPARMISATTLVISGRMTKQPR